MIKIIYTALFINVCLILSLFAEELCCLESPDLSKSITIRLTDGRLYYSVKHNNMTVISESPLGLKCESYDFSRKLTLLNNGSQQLRREKYQLLIGNKLSVDSKLKMQSLSFNNADGIILYLDLVAGEHGIGFRYRFSEGESYNVTDEITGFLLPANAKGWIQPYHAAGPYTPAYEDFYYNITSGDQPPVSRAEPRGWCFPGLFHISDDKGWVFLAETDVDGGYCASHLENDSKNSPLYRIKFAYADEVTGAKRFDTNAKRISVSAVKTPWRIIVMGNQVTDIFNSTMVTDLAESSKIDDTSWIKTGRASWSWWSHPEGPDTNQLYNQFTDLAVEFGWEYTLFDAGWWNADIGKICNYAGRHGIIPMAWTGAGDFFSSKRCIRKLDEMLRYGVKGIKVDFWCSDTQKTMAAMHNLLKEAAARKLIVVLHGCTIPRGWHRTWPNLLTAEAVLGVESYFYESSYPAKTAEQNTILPFTRNIMAPMDVTPVGITMRKFPRKTSAVHEIAASIVGNSGIIHFADSVEMFNKLPKDVKQVLKQAPAKWDETVCLVGEPGKAIVVARRTDNYWYIAGLNGTDKLLPVSLDLSRFEGSDSRSVLITEGKDQLTQFTIEKISDYSQWAHTMPAWGGFIISIQTESSK